MNAFKTGRDVQRTACDVARRSFESSVRYAGTLILILLFGGVPVVSDRDAQAATVVRVDAVEVAPERVSVGVRPQITIRISRERSGDAAPASLWNIIVVVRAPDHAQQSWQWSKEIAAGKSVDIVVPKSFPTTMAGKYVVEAHVYEKDMRRRIATKRKEFEVVLPQAAQVTAAGKEKAPTTEKEKPVSAAIPRDARSILEAGVHVNGLNPAGGGSAFLWPFRHVGLQGVVTAGTFLSYEGRIIVRIPVWQRIHPYVGVGYLQVNTTKDVIGVQTEFKDSGAIGIIGLEYRISNSWRAYVEAGAASIDLEELVTNGGQTVKATVDYAPVTISAGLVFALF